MNWLFRKNRSAQNAKERLQFVLVNDRTNLSAAELTEMKDEILQVISRHVDIDTAAVQIAVEQDGRAQRLVADIPLKSVTRRRAG